MSRKNRKIQKLFLDSNPNSHPVLDWGWDSHGQAKLNLNPDGSKDLIRKVSRAVGDGVPKRGSQSPEVPMSIKQVRTTALTIDEAVKVTSRSRSTLKGALLTECFPNAFQANDRNRTSQIPLWDLVDADYLTKESSEKYEQQLLKKVQEKSAKQAKRQITSQPLQPNLQPSQHYLPITTSKLAEIAAQRIEVDESVELEEILRILLAHQIAITELLLAHVKALVRSDLCG